MSDLIARLHLKEQLSTDGLLSVLETVIGNQPKREEKAEGSGPCRRAAAVLHLFDPHALSCDAGKAPLDDSARAALAAISVPAVGYAAKALRTLNAEPRREALAELGGQQAFRAALNLNPAREMTNVQTLFEAWLEKPLDLNTLTYAELEALRSLSEWKLDRFGDFPSEQAIDLARARRASVALFDHLVDRSFVGREVELQILRDYVGIVSPTIWAQLRAFLNAGPQPPLVVSGPGGAGKTALIGRFLLEHVQAPQQGWFPFVYLPFDTATIDVREPWTLLNLACEQLAAQALPDQHAPEPSDGAAQQVSVEAAVAAFRAAVKRYGDERERNVSRTASLASQSDRFGRADVLANELYSNFARLLTALSARSGSRQNANQVPVVLVLDTFEEVVYRTNEDLENLWRMLSAVQIEFPALRVVISGRVEPRLFTVNGKPPELLAIGDLTEKDAQTMLERLGVESADARTAIILQVGRSPLTLKIAARAAKDMAVDANGIPGVAPPAPGALEIAPELIRGQLYRRILDHIHDPSVRCLAHPGMVLRRITPELIRQVLAPMCAEEERALLDVDEKRAEMLFEQLRREHSLVRLEDDQSLRFREEVRTPMLRLLSADKPDLVEQMHRAAANFYEWSDGCDQPAAQAEKLYHHMMLGDPPRDLDHYWCEGLAPYLGTAIEEIPDEAKIWLASHMSIELPPDIYARANLIEWERITGGKAQEALRYSTPSEVLNLLETRAERTAGSPLYALEMRVRMSLGKDDPAQYQSALDLARRAIESWPIGKRGGLAEILWFAAQAARGLGDQATARARLGELITLAKSIGSRLARVQALTELVLLSEGDERSLARLDLAQAVEALTPSEVDTERALVRLASVRLGGDFAALVQKLLPYTSADLLFGPGGDAIDIGAAVPEVVEALSGAEGSEWHALRAQLEQVSKQTADTDSVLNLLREVLRLSMSSPNDAATRAVLAIFAAEKGDLHASGLAGVDRFREGFQLRGSAEVAA